MKINILGMLWSLVEMFLRILIIPFKIIVFALILLLLVFVFYYIVFRFKGYKLPKFTRKPYKKSGFFKKIFYEFPTQFLRDLFEKDPDYFGYQGLHIFCGEQGSGKTMSVVEFITRIQKEYPLAKCMTNFAYTAEDDSLTDYRQISSYTNGIKGVIVGIDELQNWFSSNESKNFPVDMLEVVTQNRKNRRIIIGTSQVFTRLSKPLREQATFIYEPYTFLGCITLVFITKPVIDSEGNVSDKKNRGLYFFVHTKELRDSYDTYKVIETLSKSGFKPKISLEELTADVRDLL